MRFAEAVRREAAIATGAVGHYGATGRGATGSRWVVACAAREPACLPACLGVGCGAGRRTAPGVVQTRNVHAWLLAAGQADAVFIGRPLLRDPSWALRAAAELGYAGEAARYPP